MKNQPPSRPITSVLVRANVALDPRDQRVSRYDPRRPPPEPIDPWGEWQRHLDAGRIGGGAKEQD